MSAPKIVVVGSLNADVTLWVPRRPSPDETLHAERVAWFRGGKGANQAVAAARLGAQVTMVGCVGDDEQGRWLLAGLAVEGIDCRHVTAAADPTGVAVITVDPDDVSIVVAAGANACLNADAVQAAAAEIAAADALLLQGEVSAAAARAAAEIARAHQTRVVLNPAPYNDVAPAVLPLADTVIVNRAEAEQMRTDTGAAIPPGVTVLVETRGAAGCALYLPAADVSAAAERDPHSGAAAAAQQTPPLPDAAAAGSAGASSAGKADEEILVPAPQVVVVDATGAGDAFAAAFAVGMASGDTPVAAAELAVRAGAWAVTVAGAQPSLPRRHQLEPSGDAD